MDQTDWKILDALQANARLSYAEIGRQVGLTPPAVAERIRKMEEARIIEGYHASVNLDKLQRPILAIIRVGMIDRKTGSFEEFVREHPAVLECIKITGQEGFYMKVAVSSMTELQNLIDNLSTYSSTETAIALSTIARRYVVERGGG
ncbi:MAG: Lrp/AsnC family transcriptional regulator [Chloroflexi bacterium]|nr:Lrp/AsnC family transcriptional regulator [Chloroflexota bacterium]